MQGPRGCSDQSQAQRSVRACQAVGAAGGDAARRRRARWSRACSLSGCRPLAQRPRAGRRPRCRGWRRAAPPRVSAPGGAAAGAQHGRGGRAGAVRGGRGAAGHGARRPLLGVGGLPRGPAARRAGRPPRGAGPLRARAGARAGGERARTAPRHSALLEGCMRAPRSRAVPVPVLPAFPWSGSSLCEVPVPGRQLSRLVQTAGRCGKCCGPRRPAWRRTRCSRRARRTSGSSGARPRRPAAPAGRPAGWSGAGRGACQNSAQMVAAPVARERPWLRLVGDHAQCSAAQTASISPTESAAPSCACS